MSEEPTIRVRLPIVWAHDHSTFDSEAQAAMRDAGQVIVITPGGNWHSERKPVDRYYPICALAILTIAWRLRLVHLSLVILLLLLPKKDA